MDDLISRKALLERLDNRTRTAYPNELYGLMLAHDYISDAPAVETGSKWIPVTERLPEKEDDYLIYVTVPFTGSKFMTVMHYEKDAFLPIWQDTTHWMPLPQPPKEGDRDG